MVKCYHRNCNREAMDGREGMPCHKHYMEEVYRLLARARRTRRKREREQRIAKGKRDA
jgi:hypothetical protein